jgi:hypothetical protein
MDKIRTGEIPHCDCKRKITELERTVEILTEYLCRIPSCGSKECFFEGPCPDHLICARCFAEHAREQAYKELSVGK